MMFVPRRVLLLASSAQPAIRLTPPSQSSSSRVSREVSAKTMFYDSHLHVWATKEDGESGKYPFAVRLSTCFASRKALTCNAVHDIKCG